MARRSFFSYKPLLVKKPSVVKYLCVWRHLTRTGLGDWCSANHQDRPGAAQQEVLAAADGMFALSLFSSSTGRKQSFPGWLAVVLVCIFCVGFPGWTALSPGTAMMSWLEPDITDGEKYTKQKTLSVNVTECGLSVFHYSIWNRHRLLLVMSWFTNCGDRGSQDTEPRKMPLTRWLSCRLHRGQALCCAFRDDISVSMTKQT